uniref:Transmembrane protein 243 n=1 Tax=Eptatretus burgeri TaxID=7764 RepID=A0A8C4QUG8_EPTBU
MAEAPAQTYGTPGFATDNTPLFRDGSRGSRIVNMVVGILTFLVVAFTVIMSFVAPFGRKRVNAMNIYFAICIVLNCFPLAVLTVWYRRGNVEQRYRWLMLYIAFSVTLLCVCALLFFFHV